MVAGSGVSPEPPPPGPRSENGLSVELQVSGKGIGYEGAFHVAVIAHHIGVQSQDCALDAYARDE